ncbi:hypothetical protein [Metabacillus fastidiosus]|uniref:hypothetical protein n=1 Tax=Metabacillus fastidiosus TaxID=1458 RepID=UPI003D2B3439
MSLDVVLIERKTRETILQGKNYEEIQEMISDCLDFSNEALLANITIELLDSVYERNSEVDMVVAIIGNYTYNVSKMYTKAMNKTISEFHGMKASVAIPILENGIKNMTANAAEYKKLNPANGWGNYEGALSYMSRLLLACGENPNATIDVS